MSRAGECVRANAAQRHQRHVLQNNASALPGAFAPADEAIKVCRGAPPFEGSQREITSQLHNLKQINSRGGELTVLTPSALHRGNR